MANGTITLTRTGSGYLTGRIVWSSESNGTQANTSTVTASLQIQRSAQNTTTGTFTGTFTVGGSSESISVHTSLPSYEWVTLKTITVTVSHNANGEGSCYLYAKVNGPGGTTMEGTSVSGAQTVALDTIPRFASIVSAPDFNDEENPTITYSNPAGNNVAALEACISLDGSAADIAYRSISKTGTTYTFSLTEAERNVLRSATGGGNSRTVFFIVRTNIGGSLGNGSIRRTFTIKNPNPTISPTITDSNSNTYALTGNRNKLVRYCSNAAVTIGASAVKQASMTSKKVTCGSKSLTADGTLNAVESDRFVFTATDSRGNTTVKTVTVPFVEYIRLTCSLANNLPDAVGNMSVRATGNYFSGSFGKTTNTLEVQYRYKVRGGSYGDWVAFETVDKGTVGYAATANLTGLDYQTAYVFQARAIDKINTNGVESAEKVVISEPVFDWGKNDFNFNVPVTMGKGATPVLLTSADDLNTIKASGWYVWTRSDAPKNVPSGANTTYISCMRVWQNGNTCLQECVDSSNSGNKGCKVQRAIYGSTVYDWEWVNPPMDAGVEYRTTERYNGKIVYVKLVNFGTLPSNTYKDVTLSSAAVTAVRIDGILNYTGESTYASLLGVSFVSSAQVLSTKIRITTNTTNATKWTAMVMVWYTKD